MIPPIIPKMILAACSPEDESGRPQLGQARALGLTRWPQSGQGFVMATFNHKAPCAVSVQESLMEYATESLPSGNQKRLARSCEAGRGRLNLATKRQHRSFYLAYCWPPEPKVVGSTPAGRMVYRAGAPPATLWVSSRGGCPTGD